jgi:hypothetical protein
MLCFKKLIDTQLVRKFHVFMKLTFITMFKKPFV